MPKAVAEEYPMTIVYRLLARVGNNELPMNEARIALRNHVASLNEEEQKEFRALAAGRSEQLMRIAEAFSQELRVIGAGQ